MEEILLISVFRLPLDFFMILRLRNFSLVEMKWFLFVWIMTPRLLWDVLKVTIWIRLIIFVKSVLWKIVNLVRFLIKKVWFVILVITKDFIYMNRNVLSVLISVLHVRIRLDNVPSVRMDSDSTLLLMLVFRRI